PRWVDAFRPIRNQLTPELAALIRDPGRSLAGSAAAAEIVSEYAANQPVVLAEAIANSGPDTFAILIKRLRPHGQRAVTLLTALLNQSTPDSGPSPNEAASQRANLAIALLRLDAGERLWPLLKATPDPRVRSFAIDRFALLGCDPAAMLARLESEPDDT